MPTSTFVESTLLLLVLLNPFLMSVYLLDLIESLERSTFRRVLVLASIISTTVFVLFAVAGDTIFSRVLQMRFASFLIFGGTLFLIIAIRYVMIGVDAIRSHRGSTDHIAGSIALPFMIGPGTISANVVAGSRLSVGWAVLSIILVFLPCS